MRRWALHFRGPTEEGLNEDQWRQWEQERDRGQKPVLTDWWKRNNKGYAAPDRKHRWKEMVYTDGSQRMVGNEEAEKEEVTAAGVWDPRNSTEEERWQGSCQTVNRVELAGIYMALTLEANEGQEEEAEMENLQDRPQATQRKGTQAQRKEKRGRAGSPRKASSREATPTKQENAPLEKQKEAQELLETALQ
ncbi:hypothetical protein CYMTET_36591 [Cymbomonas tetramitiformis]|uniref:Uncharacterized protein n=1 Tax=Cymbomonas tetramitiformis TaxID=36881 RepID=A0AAE0CH68_9CHLO|nr:hypothetical protein CYMTET_36591 [Cymbomonas tetramitiformis]